MIRKTSDHGHIVSVTKWKFLPHSTSYLVEFADGFREGRIKVYDPVKLNELTEGLNRSGIEWSMDPLKSPPEPKGVTGCTIKFDFDELTRGTPELGEGR